MIPIVLAYLDFCSCSHLRFLPSKTLVFELESFTGPVEELAMDGREGGGGGGRMDRMDSLPEDSLLPEIFGANGGGGGGGLVFNDLCLFLPGGGGGGEVALFHLIEPVVHPYLVRQKRKKREKLDYSFL